MIDDLIQRIAGEGNLGLVAGAALLLAYAMPVTIAVARKHRFTGAIGAINLLLGWTVVGWIAALFWAVNRDLREPAPAHSRFGEPQFALEPQIALEPVWTDPDGIATSIRTDATNATDATDATRKCPFCAELIKAEAVVCRYCSRDLPVVQAVTPYGTIATDSLDERGMRELYDLLQDMERDAAREYHEARFTDVMDRVDAIRAAEIRSDEVKSGEIKPEGWPDGIGAGEIVVRRDSGTTPTGKRRAARIQKAG